jgi:hypothetical protein
MSAFHQTGRAIQTGAVSRLSGGIAVAMMGSDNLRRLHTTSGHDGS